MSALRNVSFEEINEVLEAFVAETGQASSLGWIRTNTSAGADQGWATTRPPAAQPHPGRATRPVSKPEVDGFAIGGRADPQRTPADHRHHPGPPERDQACEIINNFTDRLRNDVSCCALPPWTACSRPRCANSTTC
jgi:flagellar motor switch protein FliG